MQQADEARDAGDFWQAALLYQKVVDRFPRALGAWVQLGNMLKDVGALDRASIAYRRALAMAPKSADIHVQLGHLAKLKGDPAAALANYAKARHLDPDQGDILRELEGLRNFRPTASDSPDLPASAGVIFAQIQLTAVGRRQ